MSCGFYREKDGQVDHIGYRAIFALRFLCVTADGKSLWAPRKGENMDLFQIDKNMATETVIEKDGLVFVTPEDPRIRLYGVFKTERGYCRMSPEVAQTVNNGVNSLNFNTAGGRVRFITNSKTIAIIAERDTTYNPDHMTFTNVAGFDIYEGDTYVSTFRPGSYVGGRNSFESKIGFDEAKERVITINFPNYGPVLSLYIGVEQGASLSPAPDYTYENPVVFYGSSVTQGGCCSRPGMNYTAVLSRMLDANVKNLGFSGSCKGELQMADYLASLDMSVLVMGFDHNAPSPEYLAEHHEPFFKRFREKRPETPVIFITRAAFIPNPDRDARLAVVQRTYDNARAAGDENVYFVPTPNSLAPIGNDGTVDGCHPNDLGFWFMAQGLYPTLKGILER